MPKYSPKNKGAAASGRGAGQRGGARRERHISIRSELRDQPDLQKIARAVVAVAMAQAEKEAQADAEARSKQSPDNLSETERE